MVDDADATNAEGPWVAVGGSLHGEVFETREPVPNGYIFTIIDARLGIHEGDHPNHVQVFLYQALWGRPAAILLYSDAVEKSRLVRAHDPQQK